MAMIRVKAKNTGYYGEKRQKEGMVFHMDEKLIKLDKDGAVVSPSWVELFDESKKSKKAIKEEIPSDDVI